VKDLTHRQQQVLDFIAEHTAQRGYPPTFRELMDRFGWRSTNAAADHLNALERKGYLKIDRTKSRGLQVMTAEKRAADCAAARLVDGIRRVAAALGVELTDPLPADWIRRCIEAAQARRAA